MADKKSSSSIDIQAMRNVEGWKSVAVWMSLIVYTAVVLYAEYHFYRLVSSFVVSSFQIVGLVAVAASAITAFALPLSLHFWFRSGLQQVAGYIFYGFHFVVMIFNLVLDSNIVSGGDVPGWITDIYGVWFLPAYIVIYGIGWSVLWFMDEDARSIDQAREVVMAERESGLNRRLLIAQEKNKAMENAFQSPAAQAAINRWASRHAPMALASEMGLSLEELGLSENDAFEFWQEHTPRPAPAPEPEPEAPPVPAKEEYFRTPATNGREPA